ncbi:hypothetical protein AMTRI_Chr01g127010 [Amborella trichopoda]|uniref:Uncharacterized protein n=1 Tax=Amborella trichopoda TaxID=13333 RepID=W1NTY7_AMBTC|nr:uncharacterized protein LOC18427058 [Amborella trichopoda]ERM99032.1 hypothetical protein AMTR_s00101p00062210 [Amborella trichopoda]|eukprot:XP_006836179.1 uncharacterized protein LOC18427058 [Amborella trichopoda]
MEDALCLHLPKLSGGASSETLEIVLQTLWKTRKTGLSHDEKDYIQGLLLMHSQEELDPVLACLRSLIRKCVHENLTGDDIQKLFPLEVPLELQSILVLLLQKYQSQWKVDTSKDQPQWPRPRTSYHAKGNTLPTQIAFSTLDMWPRQDETEQRSTVVPTTPSTELNPPRLPPLQPQHDDGPPQNLMFLPRLKSMTWAMENQNSTPANRVAIITLKLQDYANSPSGETEEKFQLSRDTLDAMLRSMAYISEQLSNADMPSSTPPMAPPSKKQRQ